MEPKSIIYLCIMVAFVLGCLVAFLLLPYLRNRKISGGITNTDPFSRAYLFKVPYTEEAFLKALSEEKKSAPLTHSFRRDTMTLYLQKSFAEISYLVSVKETEGGCLVCLKQASLVFEKSAIPFFINEFMVVNYQAEPLPFETYSAYFNI